MTDLDLKTLRLLSDGAFRSGEKIARTLAVSRTSVWNSVEALTASGAEIYRVRGRGYRLARPISMLDEQSIRNSLGATAGRCALHVLDRAASTNTTAMQFAQAGAPAGTVVVAEMQTAGRGRMGRRWFSGLGDALTFSVVLRFAQGAGLLSGLSLAVGVAVARAAERLGATEVALKWPNDVLWRERKLAGILIEMQGDALGPSVVVVGIGINVRPQAAVGAQAGVPVADLETAGAAVLDRNRVLAVLLQELFTVSDAFAGGGFVPMRAEWERRHAYAGRAVTLIAPAAPPVHGIARGIGDDGALLIEINGATRRVHSGEVSLRAGKANP